MMAETITINGRAFRIASSTPVKSIAGKRKAHRAIPRPLDGEPVESGTLSLSMAPPSVNALFFNRAGRGRGRGKTLAYRNWRAFADQELRAQPSWHVPGKVRIAIRVGATRGDCDNRIKAALDALVTAGRIEDDRNVAKVSAEFSDITGTVIEIARAA